MNRRTHLLAWTAAACVALALGACGKESDPLKDGSSPATQTKKICPVLGEVQDEYGVTLGGILGGASFAEYRFAEKDGRAAVTPPNDSACARQIGERLKLLCTACQSLSVDECLTRVETVMNTPSAECTACGDGICSAPAETRQSCEADCRCGNGDCEFDLGETLRNCPADCRGGCGDGFCASPLEECACPEGEPDCQPCAVDCCTTVCGNGTCEAEQGETLESCEQDCSAFCGDGLCLSGENVQNCPADCRGSLCGNSICEPPETCFSCPGDCGIAGEAACLDGICGECEMWSCAADCGQSGFRHCRRQGDQGGPCPAGSCGDGTCDPAETPANCPWDCPWAGDAACGDRTCDRVGGENQQNCARDCLAATCNDRLCTPDARTAGCPACGCAGTNVICAPDIAWCAPGEAPTARYTCTDGCPKLERCPAGRCRESADGGACIDCPTPLRDTPLGDIGADLCEPGSPGFCLGDRILMTCTVAPGFSDKPACSTWVPVACGAGCVDGACRPCGTNPDCPAQFPFCDATGACKPRCGDNRCDSVFESPSTCPGDCGTCGDGRCERGEDPDNCAQDCGCGDGVCSAGENTANCPADCKCGDGVCSRGETRLSCAADCRCGDGVCAIGDETRANCPQDCICGDGVCDAITETRNSCGRDCNCGDGICDREETRDACPADCTPATVCGDGICQAWESSASCPNDCFCGDGECSPHIESTATCADDCRCGDGICDFENNEDTTNCPQDCSF